MCKVSKASLLVFLFIVLLNLLSSGYGICGAIAYTSPVRNIIGAEVNTDIVMYFNVRLLESSVNEATIKVHSSLTGYHQGAISYDDIAKTVTFDPIADFNENERVTISISTVPNVFAGVRMHRAWRTLIC